MKKWMAGVLATGCMLAPQSAQAQTEELPVQEVLMGAERVQAYWVVGFCAVAFVLLVCIWSVQLKHASDRTRRASVRIRPPTRT